MNIDRERKIVWWRKTAFDFVSVNILLAHGQKKIVLVFSDCYKLLSWQERN